MTVTSVRAYPVRIPRQSESTGLAGSPARLQASTGAARYRWAENYPTVYSTEFETTLVRVKTSEGITGLGEAQSPVAPEITTAVVNELLGPMLVGQDPLAVEHQRDRLYAAMRVRGHTGGFLLDAIAGIDIALWDICGKKYGIPVYQLLGGAFRTSLPAYISGLAGTTIKDKLEYARRYVAEGATCFKVFLDATERECIDLVEAMRSEFPTAVRVAVDGLWRLTRKSAIAFARKLERLEVAWLEAPLAPEDVNGLRAVARSTELPIACGESYRSRFEMLPFFRAEALDIVQPDIGRTGIAEGRKIANLAEAFHVTVAPHISIGLGPQIAAALHFAAAIPNLLLVECNPTMIETANRFAKVPIAFGGAAIAVPDGPGLGIEYDGQALRDVLA